MASPLRPSLTRTGPQARPPEGSGLSPQGSMCQQQSTPKTPEGPPGKPVLLPVSVCFCGLSQPSPGGTIMVRLGPRGKRLMLWGHKTILWGPRAVAAQLFLPLPLHQHVTSQ